MTNESGIEPALEAKLKRMRLRVELADADTLTLKRVPADQQSFSKARTNLLIKRSTEGMPCVVCVDEDLDYMGTDQALAHAFAAGPTQQGWRVLTFGGSLHGDLSSALEYALNILGADKESANHSVSPIPSTKRLLVAFAENLTDVVKAGAVTPPLFREEEIEHVAACTLSMRGHLPLILGASGTGKTNLIHGIASLLAQREKEVLAVNLGSIMSGTLFESEREALLKSLLSEARDSKAIVVFEQAEWALIGVFRGPLLIRDALDHGARLIATSALDQEPRFAAHP